jgi:hypothetical protein
VARNLVVRGRSQTWITSLIDDEDYEWASQYRWFLSGTPSSSDKALGYVTRSVLTGTTKPKWGQSTLHTEILTRMGFTVYDVGDHINRNVLDNRRENLRPATFQLNAQNRTKSPFTGRPRTLPDAEPRACKACGIIFTPRRKSPGRIYCSKDCQRSAAWGKSKWTIETTPEKYLNPRKVGPPERV